MDELPLRPYQEECITATFNDLNAGLKRLAIVLPTGGGKTVIFSYIMRHWHTTWNLPGRCMVLVHRDELATQAVNKIKQVAPNLNVGVVKAEYDEHDGADIIVGSVQTLRNLTRLDRVTRTGRIGLLIVDECHHATADSYQLIMRELGCYEDDSAVALGFTATLSRNDKTSLGDVWEKVTYRKDILDLIMPDQSGNRYLSNVTGRRVQVNGFSIEDIAMSSGDYEAGALSRALLSSDAPDFIADAYVEHAKDKPGIVFSPTVDTAMAFSDALTAKGMVSEPVWGAMKSADRANTLRRAFRGQTQVLVNCMVLTEGFDWPRAECGVIARPTTSASLYVQMVGRMLRLHPDKKEALILDVVGASEMHRLATLADLTSRRIELIYEGESLLEAVQREQANQNPALKNYVVTWEDVNLFQSSMAAWNKTYKGIWFIGTQSWIYFLWPGADAGLYHVGKLSRQGGKAERLHQNIPLDLAMSWAETEAFGSDSAFFGTNTSRRDASWRRRKESATEKQVNWARALGVRVPDGATKNDASILIDRHLASKMLDKSLR